MNYHVLYCFCELYMLKNQNAAYDLLKDHKCCLDFKCDESIGLRYFFELSYTKLLLSKSFQEFSFQKVSTVYTYQLSFVFLVYLVIFFQIYVEVKFLLIFQIVCPSLLF